MESNKNLSYKVAEGSPGFLLWQVSTIWRQYIENLLDPLRLSHPEFVVLATSFWLKRSHDHVMQTDIAKHTKLSNMHVSKVLRALEKKLLIQRTMHAKDTRAKSIIVSREGSMLLRKAIKQVESFDRNFFAPLEAKMVEFNQLLNSLVG